MYLQEYTSSCGKNASASSVTDMDKPGYYADTIKARVDLTEALEYYGITFNKAGFASCPFHSGAHGII